MDLVSVALTASTFEGLRGYVFAKRAHTAWALQCKEGAALPFEAFEVDRPPHQNTLAARLHPRKIKALLQGSTRMRIFREHMTLSEEKKLSTVQPIEEVADIDQAPVFYILDEILLSSTSVSIWVKAPECVA